MAADSTLPTVFFAYPSSPTSCGDAIRRASAQITERKIADCTTWEDLTVGGRVLISAICSAIDDSDVVVADITNLNPNVLFELGYAIATEKRVWLLNDTTIRTSNDLLRSFRLLSTVGYVSYSNSQHIVDAFTKESPHYDLESTLYRDLLSEHHSFAKSQQLLYLRSSTANETGLRLDATVQEIPSYQIDDPDESPNRSLADYAKMVWSSCGVLVHLTSPGRVDHNLVNARHSLVAGMALGWKRALRILAEGDFLSPADYRDLASHYRNSDHAIILFEQWISDVPRPNGSYATRTSLTAKEFSGDLRSLDLGDYVAEDEEQNLVDKYFVETKVYLDAVAGKNTIFVGRRGTGKSANFLKLKAELASDRRNLVVPIKPVSYELNGLVELLTELQGRANQSHVLESLWTYLIYSEIAKVQFELLQSRDRSSLDDGELALYDFMSGENSWIRDGFSVRLHHVVTRLLDKLPDLLHGDPKRNSGGLTEAIYSDAISKLSKILFNSINPKHRIYVLLDNLDKAWDKGKQADSLIPVLLSLFGVTNNLRGKFLRHPSGPVVASFSICIFVRADIFIRTLAEAREPDKIAASTIKWSDPEQLLSIAERRYVAESGSDHPEEFWQKYFCAEIDGVATRDFIAQSIRRRPRDLLYLLNKAVEYAVNRRHSSVEMGDLKDALMDYSKFAIDSIVVENGVTIQELTDIFYSMLGDTFRLTPPVLAQHFANAGVSRDRHEHVVDHLIRLGFLGIEIGRDHFWYADDLNDLRRSLVLAQKLAGDEPMRLKVHPAYRPYLELIQ